VEELRSQENRISHLKKKAQEAQKVMAKTERQVELVRRKTLASFVSSLEQEQKQDLRRYS